MLKKITGLLVLASLFAWFSPVLAAQPNYAPEFPEKSGTYDVPGHPNMKLKVFVHKPKPAKPGSIQTPQPGTCTADLGSDAIVGDTGWHLPSEFTYRLNTASVPTYVGPGNLSGIANAAFNEWTSAIPNKVALTNAGTTLTTRATYDRQNIITWGRTSGSALAVTYTWYYTSGGEVAEVDTIMNNKFFWTWNSGLCYANSYDAQNILTHELGHWFGLDDYYDSDYVNNTMYGYGSKSETKKSTLTTGDINGIKALY